MKDINYTSNRNKLFNHLDRLDNYRNNNLYTVVSTHISPEASCNLRCSYCSVKKRNSKERIELEVIKDYILRLEKFGLKSIILTGGGEPTLYKNIQELVDWIKQRGLKLAIITNGINTDTIKNWNIFDWIRISVNKGYEDDIQVPFSKGIIGFSIVYNGEQDLSFFKKIKDKAYKNNIDYIRVVPDCLNSTETIKGLNEEIKKILNQINDDIFFHQSKNPKKQYVDICHQSFLRPYLSEVDGGTVFPCDSVVLNTNSNGYFSKKYALCKPNEIGSYLSKEIYTDFKPSQDCDKCAFYDNIDTIEKYINNNLDSVVAVKVNHEDFI